MEKWPDPRQVIFIFKIQAVQKPKKERELDFMKLCNL